MYLENWARTYVIVSVMGGRKDNKKFQIKFKEMRPVRLKCNNVDSEEDAMENRSIEYTQGIFT